MHSSLGSADYKAVIIAAPLHNSNIEIPTALLSQIPEQPVSSLHVTVLTTTLPVLNAEYFALPVASPLPKRILTTHDSQRQDGKEPEFYSISYSGLVRDGEWAVKILSKESLSDEWLANIFENKIGWIHRKEVRPFFSESETVPDL